MHSIADSISERGKGGVCTQTAFAAVAALIACAFACVIACASPVAAFADDAEGEDEPKALWEGAGTQDDPYLVKTADDLVALSTYVNGNAATGAETTKGKYYQLANDVDLGGVASFTPIGYVTNANYYFGGTFDGAGHAIYNLNVNMSLTGGRAGLFGRVNGATIENLVVKGGVYQGITQPAGGVVAEISGASTLMNVGSEVNVTSTVANTSGGIVGTAAAGTVIDSCYNKGDITSTIATGNVYAGGIVGQLYAPNANTKVTNCYNLGTVSIARANNARIGGIVGNHTGTSASNAPTLANLFNAGTLELPSNNVNSMAAGIVGSSISGANFQISNCYALTDLFAASFKNEGTDCKKVSAVKMAQSSFAATMGDAFKAAGDVPALAWECDFSLESDMADAVYKVGASDVKPLSAAVSLAEGAVKPELAFTWYRIKADGSVESFEGTTSEDGLGSTYTPSAAELGESVYYCVASAKGAQGDVSGKQLAARSSQAAITVYTFNQAVAPEVELVTAAEVLAYQGRTTDVVVYAEIPEGTPEGSLSYEWYEMAGDAVDEEADQPVTDGSGRFSDTFNPNTAELGTRTYYCKVSNLFENQEPYALSEPVKVTVDVLTIGTPRDLALFLGETDRYTNKTVKLGADLDMKDFSALAPKTAFDGTFDGQGHTIYNLDIVSGGNVGLFAVLGSTMGGAGNAVVKDLHLQGKATSTIAGPGAFLGGLAGAVNRAEIENVGVDMDISAPNAKPGIQYGTNQVGRFELGTYTYAGGLVGGSTGSYYTTVKNSYARGAVNVGDGIAGGLIGAANNTGKTTVGDATVEGVVFENCYFTGALKGLTVGGVAGSQGWVSNPNGADAQHYFNNASKLVLKNVYTTFDSVCADAYPEGVRGFGSTADFVDQYMSLAAGGICGRVVSNSNAQVVADGAYYNAASAEGATAYSAATTMLSDTTPVAGEAKTAAELKELASALGDAFKADSAGGNDGFPLLAWEPQTVTDISGYSLELANESLPYAGSALDAGVIVKDAAGNALDSYKAQAVYFADEACTEQVEPVHAGTYYVKAQGVGKFGYAGTTTAVKQFTVTKAKLTAAYVSETCGKDETPALEVSYDGFLVNDSAATAKDFEAPTVTVDAMTVGAHELAPAGGSAADYEFAYEKGTLTVNSGTADKPVAENFVYTGKEQGVAPASAVYSEDGTARAVNAGDYEVTFAVNEGYSWSDGTTDSITLKWSIGKAPLTATYAGDRVAYKDASSFSAAPTYTVNVEGFVDGESAANAAGYKAPAVDASGIAYKCQSTALAPAGGEADNYSFTYVAGRLNVTGTETSEVPVLDQLFATNTARWVYDGESHVALKGGTGYAITDVSPYNKTYYPDGMNTVDAETGNAVIGMIPAGSYSFNFKYEAKLADGYVWSNDADGNVDAVDKTISFWVNKKVLWAKLKDQTLEYGVLPPDSIYKNLDIEGVLEKDAETVQNTIVNGTELFVPNSSSTTKLGGRYGQNLADFNAGDHMVTTSGDGNALENYTFSTLPRYSSAVTNEGGHRTGNDRGKVTITQVPLTATPTEQSVAVGSDVSSVNKDIVYAGWKAAGNSDYIGKDNEKSYYHMDSLGDLNTKSTLTAPTFKTTDEQLATMLKTPGDYTLELEGGSATNYTFDLKTATLHVVDSAVAKPSLPADTTFTYDGTEKAPAAIAASDDYTVDGDLKATNAGTYKITVTLKAGKRWAGDATDVKPLEVEWTIKPAELYVPTGFDTSFTYDGAEKELAIPANANYEIGGTTKATDAGTYTATVTPKANYAWVGKTGEGATGALEIGWSVVDYSISSPEEGAEYTYNGKEQGPEAADDAKFTVSAAKQVNVGEYTATLTPKAGYYWGSDKSDTAAKTLNWKIVPAAVTVSPHAASKAFGEEDPEFTYDVVGLVGDDALGNVKVSRAEGEDVGVYAMTAAYDANVNYAVTVAEADFEIGYAAVEQPTLSQNSFVYDGDEHSVSVEGAGFTVDGTAKATDAGSYTVAVTPDKNHKWAENGKRTKVSLGWTIERARIEADPEPAADLVYDGEEKTGIAQDDRYTAQGATATDAGTYTAQVTPAANYAWADGGTWSHNVVWAIANAPAVKQGLKVPESLQLEVGSAAGAIAASVEVEGAQVCYASSDEAVATVDAEGNVTPVAAGTATITVTSDAANYETATAQVLVTVSEKKADDGKQGGQGAGQEAAAQVAPGSTQVVADPATAGTYVISSDGKSAALDAFTGKGTSASVNTVVIGGKAYPVTKVGARAFAGTNVTAVTLGDNVTAIAAGALDGSKVKSLSVGKGVSAIPAKAFKGAKALTTFKGASQLSSIGKLAFQNCTSLKTVKVTSKKLKTIGAQAFKNCKKLKKLSIAKTTKLTKKSVKGSLKGSKVKTVDVVNSKAKAYRKFFTKANAGVKATVK